MPFYENDNIRPSSEKVVLQEMSRTLQSFLQEDARIGISAETFLASSAAIFGGLLREETDSPSDKDNIVRPQIERLSTDMRKVAFENAIRLSSCPSLYETTRGNVLEQKKVVLTNSPYHNPHMPPDECGALLLPELKYLANAFGISKEDTLSVCRKFVVNVFTQICAAVPPDVAYKLAVESATGVAFAPAADREKATNLKKLFITKRIIAAANELCGILVKQNIALERGKIHPQSLVAEAGAFLGRTVRTVGDKNIDADYLISVENDAFLEECNIMIMASYINRGGDAKNLLEYEEYIKNTTRSFGKKPFPQHDVPINDQPHSGAFIKASIVHEMFSQVITKYDLQGWEKASTALTAANDCIRLAEVEVPNLSQGKISTKLAVRLLLEEAAANARIKPFNFDEEIPKLPTKMRDTMMSERALVRKAMNTIHLPFG